MTVKELFDFVTDPTINESNMEQYLEKLMQIASERPYLTNDQKTEDEVFKHSYIPHNMNEVVDFERDFRRAKQGQPLIYTTLHGIMPDLSKPREMPEILKTEAEGVGEETREKGVEKTLDQEESDDENEEEDTTEDEEDSDDDEDDSDMESEEEGEEDEEGGEKKSKIRMEIHMRPRDESPNSKKVSIFRLVRVRVSSSLSKFKGILFFLNF